MSKGDFHVRAAAVRSIVAASFLVVALAISFGTIRGFGGVTLAATPPQADSDWTYADHDFNGTRYSPLTQITPGNVKQRQGLLVHDS